MACHKSTHTILPVIPDFGACNDEDVVLNAGCWNYDADIFVSGAFGFKLPSSLPEGINGHVPFWDWDGVERVFEGVWDGAR